MSSYRTKLSFDSWVPRKAAAQLICVGKRLISVEAGYGFKARVASLLTRKWMLEPPDTIIKTYRVPNAPSAEVTVLHDDLLHPVLGGNKLRKLDALIPALLGSGVTDVVTCGGLQSAHTAAVAAACAEQGLRAHLLVRGERPQIPTGYHLLSLMYGQVTYVPRSEYALRETMLQQHAARIAAEAPPDAKVSVMEEGAASPLACLGLIRLAAHLAEMWATDDTEAIIIVDSGTGTTAIGLALGAALLGLPWKIVGVMLAGQAEYYTQQQRALTDACSTEFWHEMMGKVAELPLEWVERLRPRSFGKVLPGEIASCRQVARTTGLLLDPIYSLAAWEVAVQRAEALSATGKSSRARICMLHCGGMHGLHGLAQRFPSDF